MFYRRQEARNFILKFSELRLLTDRVYSLKICQRL